MFTVGLFTRGAAELCCGRTNGLIMVGRSKREGHVSSGYSESRSAWPVTDVVFNGGHVAAYPAVYACHKLTD